MLRLGLFFVTALYKKNEMTLTDTIETTMTATRVKLMAKPIFFANRKNRKKKPDVCLVTYMDDKRIPQIFIDADRVLRRRERAKQKKLARREAERGLSRQEIIKKRRQEREKRAREKSAARAAKEREAAAAVVSSNSFFGAGVSRNRRPTPATTTSGSRWWPVGRRWRS
jgi:hypothetical protein